MTICDISGVRSSPLDSGESSRFQWRRWESVKYCVQFPIQSAEFCQIPPESAGICKNCHPNFQCDKGQIGMSSLVKSTGICHVLADSRIRTGLFC